MSIDATSAELGQDALAVPRAQPPPRGQNPWRLLGIAVLWLIAVLAVLALVVLLEAIAAGVVTGLHNRGIPPGPARWAMPTRFFSVSSLFIMQGAMALAALHRGRIEGASNRRLGLGWLAIQKPLLLVGLAAAIPPVVLLWASFLTHLLAAPPATALAPLLGGQPGDANWIVPAIVMASAVVAAPLAEELFFRGWLWQGLRRAWGPVAVSVATALPWLAMHASDGLERTLYLVPSAILLSVARHKCGSVRASIALHSFNNFLAVALIKLAPLIHA